MSGGGGGVTAAGWGELVAAIRTIALPVAEPALRHTGIGPGAAEQARAAGGRTWKTQKHAGRPKSTTRDVWDCSRWLTKAKKYHERQMRAIDRCIEVTDLG